MAGSGRVLFGKKIAIIEQYQERHSKEQIEEFFGITIKKVMKGKDTRYNVYKDGELVLAEVGGWEASDLFTGSVLRLSNLLL